MPGMVKKILILLSFVTLFSLPAFADDLYITYTMPALRSFQDGFSYDPAFDASGNAGNSGHGVSYKAGNWWYMTYAMPQYSGSGVISMKEHLINVVGGSSVVSFSQFGLAGENASGGLGSWYYPAITKQGSASHTFNVNNSSFYVVANDLSFSAYKSYGLTGTDYVRLGHVTSPALRLGFDNDIVYDGAMFGGSLTMKVPYEVTPDNYVTTANLNSAVSDLKATIEANSATTIDYTSLLNQINSTMNSIKTSLTSSDPQSDGNGTLYYYVRYMYYNLQSILGKVTSVDSTLHDVDSELSAMNSTLELLSETIFNIDSTLKTMQAHVSNIDDNLQYIADEFRAQDQLGQAAAGAAGDQTQDTLSNSQTGLSGINSTISDSGTLFTDLSGNGFSGFLGATFGTVLSAAPAGSTLNFKRFIILFISLSVILVLVRVFLMGGSDD